VKEEEILHNNNGKRNVRELRGADREQMKSARSRSNDSIFKTHFQNDELEYGYV